MSKAPSRPEAAPSDPLLAVSCLDFLLIELVPLAERIAEQIHAREQAMRDGYKRSKLFDRSSGGDDGNKRNSVVSTRSGKVSTHTAPTATATADVASSARDSISGTAGETTTAGMVEEDDESREALFWRLDQMGYRVGQGLAERWVRPEESKSDWHPQFPQITNTHGWPKS